MNYRMIAQLLGKVLCTIAAVLLLPAIICLLYRESPLPFLAVTGIMALCGALLLHETPDRLWIPALLLPVSGACGGVAGVNTKLRKSPD